MPVFQAMDLSKLRIECTQHVDGRWNVIVTIEVNRETRIILASSAGLTKENAAGWCRRNARKMFAEIDAMLTAFGATEVVEVVEVPTTEGDA